jgi:hypothetical protein
MVLARVVPKFGARAQDVTVRRLWARHDRLRSGNRSANSSAPGEMILPGRRGRSSCLRGFTRHRVTSSDLLTRHQLAIG